MLLKVQEVFEAYKLTLGYFGAEPYSLPEPLTALGFLDCLGEEFQSSQEVVSVVCDNTASVCCEGLV